MWFDLNILSETLISILDLYMEKFMPFVSVEGIDGSGKSAQSERLAAALRKMEFHVIKTKEPDGGMIGVEVRSILVADLPVRLSHLEEMLLISAARANHVTNVIRPALDDGSWVVSDRYVDSTYAFQVHETGVPEQLFLAITSEVVGDTMPDLTFVLDIEPDIALHRRTARGADVSDDPSEITRDFARIRSGLLTLARREPGRCRVIDASRSEEEVADLILAEVKKSGLIHV
jgi:dTMP kinase